MRSIKFIVLISIILFHSFLVWAEANNKLISFPRVGISENEFGVDFKIKSQFLFGILTGGVSQLREVNSGTVKIDSFKYDKMGLRLLYNLGETFETSFYFGANCSILNLIYQSNSYTINSQSVSNPTEQIQKKILIEPIVGGQLSGPYWSSKTLGIIYLGLRLPILLDDKIKFTYSNGHKEEFKTNLVKTLVN